MVKRLAILFVIVISFTFEASALPPACENFRYTSCGIITAARIVTVCGLRSATDCSKVFDQCCSLGCSDCELVACCNPAL